MTDAGNDAADRADERSDRIGRWIEEALRLDPAARAAFLDAECGDDSALRAEIESLLAHHGESHDFFDDLARYGALEMDAIARLNGALEGRYSISGAIGSGGMANVYLADDLRHERRVAIKVLRPELAAVLGADRFLGEIRTTANLQHPHILPLFDSGEADGFLYFVTPYVAGESLRDRLERERQLPVDEAVRIATAVAAALDHAHRHGVIHRDVKPANILLHEGEPLVADFGIALAVGAAGGGRLTETGLSLGTPRYMSPEQVTVDGLVTPATDVWALGCVLFEMLVGEAPYTGSTTRETILRIVRAEPVSAGAVRNTVPLNVDAAIRRALERLPSDRFAGAREFATALTDPAFRHGGTPDAAGAPASRRMLAGLLALVALLAFAAAWGWLRAPRGALEPRSLRLDVNLPSDQMLSVPPTRAFPFDVSPDGRLLVYAAVRDGVAQLYLRPLDRFEATPLPGTEGARQPFFSWTGDRIGFFVVRTMRWIPLTGGAPFDVTTIRGNPAGASWGPDDEIVFGAEAARFLGAALYRVPASGGVPQPFETRPPADAAAEGDSISIDGAWPRHLPDGRHILLSRGSRTWLADLRSGASVPLLAGSQAQYVPSDHLVYSERGPVLRSVSFDPAAHRVTGQPTPLLDDVFRGFASGGRLFRVARESGTLVFVEDRFDRSVVLVDHDGSERVLGGELRAYRWPVPSPDGSRIIVHEQTSNRQWEFDVATGRATPLDGDQEFGIFGPDGRYFAGSTTLTEIGPDGRPRGDPVVDWGERIFETDWAADGGAVIGQTIAAGSGFDMWIARAADGWRRDTLVVTENNEYDGRISPDGRWLAYTSDRSGRDEVWVTSFPALEGLTLVSTGGGTSPLWSRDGPEIFYRSGDRVMAVAVSTGSQFAVTGAPAVLFRGDYGPPQVQNWALAPDGRFVMIRHAPNALRQFHVIANLGAELAAAGRSR